MTEQVGRGGAIHTQALLAVHDKLPAASRQLIKQLYNSLFGIFFLGSLLLSIGLFVCAGLSSGTIETVWLGMATSLLASTVFSSLHVLVTGQANERLLRASVEGAAQDVANAVLEEQREKERLYFPLAEYDETKTFNARFNRDLTQDLKTTDKYVFNGLTGRYIGPRLENTNRRINRILVIVGDSRSADAVRVRIEHRPAESGSYLEKIREGLRDDIDLCIIGLFQNRFAHGSMEVILTPTPILDRVEICDGASYLTLFSARADERSTFPRTLRWSPDSPLHRTMLREAERTAESSANLRLRITPSMRDEQLLTFYRDKLDRDMDADELGELVARFTDFSHDFSTQLASL